MEHRVTIKEIAAEAGVSTGTVHRALYGKKGLSEQTRQQILDLCARRGYRANSAASALKRSALRIAAAFPGPQEENSYFYGSVWHGFRRCMAELDAYANPSEPVRSAAKELRAALQQQRETRQPPRAYAASTTSAGWRVSSTAKKKEQA